VHALELEELQVRYGDRIAVRNLTLTVEPGEIFGLIGPNGAGKTSTLSVVEGLLVPSAGRVRVFGVDPARDRRRAKASIGVQLQSTAFQPDLTLQELVQLYAGLYGVRMDLGHARQRLAEAGLGDASRRRAQGLSGGQGQRLSLLIACIHDPPLLLLDEPTTGLDPASRRELWQQIARYRAGGRSVLLTTHSMEEAAPLSARIGILVRGELAALDAPTELVRRYATDPRVQRTAHGNVTLEDVFLALTASEEVLA
jgi:ABC-2 type transport system ATP-binding protein